MDRAWNGAVALLVLAGCEIQGQPDAGRRYEACRDGAGQEAARAAAAARAAGDSAGELAALRRAVELCPEAVPLHARYRELATALGGTELAAMRAHYENLPDDVRSPVPAYLKSWLIDDDATRVRALEEALRRDPRFYWANVELGLMWRRLRRTDQAIDAFQQALTVQPQCAVANLELAELLVLLGRGREAAPLYRRYLELRPDDRAAAEDFLALLIYELGDLDTAELLVLQLVEADPRDPDVLMDLAAIRWKRGGFHDAIGLYRAVLSNDPRRARAVLNLANLYFGGLAGDDLESRQQWWPKARAAYRYYLALGATEDIGDMMDLHFAVPYRLALIADLLGPASTNPPTLDDF